MKATNSSLIKCLSTKNLWRWLIVYVSSYNELSESEKNHIYKRYRSHTIGGGGVTASGRQLKHTADQPF